ncbi:MAG TPA: hypothetical protein VMD59_11010, partial [Acidimicrobiales bacterium]|nr:hypothetical protein [Acidimicrobiales bacterium]
LSADTLPDVGSALVHGSRLRTRFPGGAAAGLIGVVESAVTGNVVANEVVPETKLIERAVGSLSLVLLPDQVPLGAAAIAVTGNVFVDPTLLPPRPSSLPAGLTDWDVLNTVVSYAPPASGS